VTGADSISTRYFVTNSFEGAMTMLGVIVGAWASGAINPRVIIGIGLGKFSYGYLRFLGRMYG